ncbi:MAG TPA: hypothetical protein VF520_10650 [Thermoleophilaceae bacterium]|jgi:4-diphosphocytidyl-2-C-methyl-D-erythritol kinase
MIEEAAPAKVNLVLHVGPLRPDGRHDLCTLMASLDLADEVAVEPAPAGPDEVICPGVEGPNLAAAAVAAYREAVGGELPPLRVTIEKRVPVAAGLGGGSADAAAVLRGANRIAGGRLGPDELRAVADRLGSDVPSQVEPRHALVAGAGERVEPIDLPPMALVLVPAGKGLATADVYAEADRIGAVRDRLDEAAVRALAGRPLDELAGAVENDLEPAALSLRPELGDTLAAVRAAGALAARVSGSGPTVFGVYADGEAARAATERLPAAIATGLRS